MATETPQTRGTAAQDMPFTTQETNAAPQETNAAPQETNAAPQETNAAPQETNAAPPEPRLADKHRVPMRKSVVVAGTVGVFAVGLLLGIGVTRYASAVPTAEASTRTSSSLAAASSDIGAAKWNPFAEIRNTQQGMDQMFDQMVAQLRRKPPLSAFADEVPGYSLSLRLKDTKDHYEVRGHLPTTGTSNVEVSLLDDQTLKVEIEDKTTEETHSKSPAGNSKVTELGQYAQILELPSPVKDEDFKVDKSKGELLITLPKA